MRRDSSETAKLRSPNARPGGARQHRILRPTTMNESSPAAELSSLLDDLLVPHDGLSLLLVIRQRLSAREREVLVAFVRSLGTKPAAQQLGTRSQTVRNQLASIRAKLQARSPVELVVKVLVALFRERLTPTSVVEMTMDSRSGEG
jgi:DNA-binding NarL/FixJ family response regulator